jgi:hypothetical protein
MSTINTNGINVNYPVPGQNQSSQGFRNNFNSIVTNLNIAATEITNLQTNVVLKAALANSTLNNDMANTLISNAATRSFRATTYNLGNALSGTAIVNASLADVQYGAVAGNVTLQFGNWAPTGTQQSIQLQLAISNANAVISFPASVISSNNNYGVTILENYANVADIATVTAPYGVSQLNYTITTTDCGNTLYITPTNRPYQTTEVQVRTPPPTGYPGDVEGTVAVDANYLYVCTSSFNSTVAGPVLVTNTYSSNNEILLNNLTNLASNAPILFTGYVIGGIVENTVYYIKSIITGNSTITISGTRSSGTAGSTLTLTTATTGSNVCTATSYNGSNIWTRTALSSW